MKALARFGPLLGRLLMAAIFLLAGVGKVRGLDATAGYIASHGLPLPYLAAAGAAAVELVGGTLLILGWRTRQAAGALLVFTALAAWFFHNFWALPPAEAQGQMIHFMKNLAMMGGLLQFVVHGGGPFSLDGQYRK